jgi:hypothetical protein
MHDGQAGIRATIAAAASRERCRWYSERPRRTEPRATMKSRMAGDAAREEKMAPPCERTLKQSGDTVKEKLRAFATQKLLKRGERFGGVIQNRENSHVLPTELATMV